MPEMSNSVTSENVALLMDPDPGKSKLSESLSDELLYTLDVTAVFKGEIIRSEEQLSRKMEALFDNVSLVNIMAVRDGWNIRFKMVVDKRNFMNLICHDNFGSFENDYDFLISDFHPNLDGNTTCYRAPDTPLKMVDKFNNIDGQNKELTITIRRGTDPTAKPAFGLKTFFLMSDPKEVIKVLEHFELVGKVARVTKASPQRPTLQIKLTASVLETFDSTNYMDPVAIYRPSPQSVEAGETELWAHLRRSDDNQRKMLTIEGVDGIVDLDEIKHRLSDQGELLTDLQPRYWESNEDELAGLCRIPNGDVSVFMDLNIELNYVIIGRDAYRVTYKNQPLQCSHCMSWHHRSGQCDRRHLGKSTLLLDYQQKWMRLVGYKERLPETNTTHASGEVAGYEATPGSIQAPDTPPPTASLFKEPKLAGEAGEDSSLKPTGTDEEAGGKWSKVEGRKRRNRGSKNLSSQSENSSDSDDTPLRTEDETNVTKTKPPLMLETPPTNVKPPSSTLPPRPPKISPKPAISPLKPAGQVKRKADSPLVNDAKTTGEGAKVTHHAERYKSVFFSDKNFMKLKDLTQRKELSTVDREKSKVEIAELESKYRKFIFENPNGRDPAEEENWQTIKTELDKVKEALRFQ